jgi:hypothetical protein
VNKPRELYETLAVQTKAAAWPGERRRLGTYFDLVETVPLAMTSNNKTNTLAILIGKVFFPRCAPWQQRVNGKCLIWSVVVGLILGLVIAAVTLYRNHQL